MLSIVLRYYPPEKQGLRRNRTRRLLGQANILRYYPPEKQGLRLQSHAASPWSGQSQILSSRKTRIKTHLCRWTRRLLRLRYYPPEKQGLRHEDITNFKAQSGAQILSSRKTRIKTAAPPPKGLPTDALRYYPPEKQGLRPVLADLIE